MLLLCLSIPRVIPGQGKRYASACGVFDPLTSYMPAEAGNRRERSRCSIGEWIVRSTATSEWEVLRPGTGDERLQRIWRGICAGSVKCRRKREIKWSGHDALLGEKYRKVVAPWGAEMWRPGGRVLLVFIIIIIMRSAVWWAVIRGILPRSSSRIHHHRHRN